MTRRTPRMGGPHFPIGQYGSRLGRLPWRRAALLAVALVAVLSLAPWARRGAIDWLARRPTQPDGAGAGAQRVAALYALGDEATVALVDEALAGDEPSSWAARRALAIRFDRWISDPSGRERTLEAALQRLAAAAPGAERQRQAWARAAAERLAEAAPRLPPAERLRLLGAIDRVAAATAPRARRAEVVAAEGSEPSEAERIAAELALLGRVEQAPASTPAEADIAPPPREYPPAAAVEEADPPSPPGGASPAAERHLVVAPPAEETPPRQPSDAAAWSPRWKAAEPVGAAAQQPSPRAAPDSEPMEVDPPLAEWDDRRLLAELLGREEEIRRLHQPSARGPRGGAATIPARDESLDALVAELSRRGFQAVSIEVVREAIADAPARRRALVDRLLVERAPSATRFLWLLAHDTDPLVREPALLALGSSADLEVVRRAWRLAVEDADPRVGRVAATLAERLR